MIASSRSFAKYEVCGIQISAVQPAQAATLITHAAQTHQSLEVHLCNAYTLSLVDSDDRLRVALERADLNLPDGTPVAWLGTRHGTKGPVRGPGLVAEVARTSVRHQVRHFLYGGQADVALAMAQRLRGEVPGFTVAGVETPPFTEVTDEAVDELANRIKNAKADIVWVGLGTPRQDYLVPRLASRLDIPIVPVGAAFDFWGGSKPEAPRFLHGSGLEWVHRLIAEPRRLWRRYLIGNPRFLLSVIRHHVRGRRRIR